MRVRRKGREGKKRKGGVVETEHEREWKNGWMDDGQTIDS